MITEHVMVETETLLLKLMARECNLIMVKKVNMFWLMKKMLMGPARP